MLEHAYADLPGVRLHYVTAGQGNLILFLHGFPEFWYAWKNQLAEFERDHQAVAPDMRGYNLSSKPPDVEQYQMKYLVEDVRGLADHLGRQRLTLVGHDWGGVVAWAFALAHPERLDRLIIVNAPHPSIFERELRENPAQQRASQYMLVFRSPQAEQLLAADNYARIFSGTFPMTEEEHAAYLEAWSQPCALTGGLNYYRAARAGPPTDGTEPAMQSLDHDGAARVVRVPTLVIWGERDTALLTGNLVGLDQLVPDLTIERIPEGSHWVIHEQPARVNALMRAFISGQGKPASQ
jgi:pimeloyl-ACP methyl ester carboxylesterase